MKLTANDIRRFMDGVSSLGREVHEKRSRWMEGWMGARTGRVAGVG